MHRTKSFIKICSAIFFIIISFTSAKSQISDLKSLDNQADYLIISSMVFKDTLNPLIAIRESQGLNVKFIDIEQIYSEFQDTLSQQEAIRHFVSYSLEYWQPPKPQYLLLVGDVHIIPSYKIQSRFFNSYNEDSVSIDDHFAINLYEDDFIPDIAIGRLPVSTNKQLYNIVDKTIYFEGQLSRSDYPMDFIGLADYRDNTIFEDQIDRIINNKIPNYYKNMRIDRRVDSPFNGTKSDIIESLNQGTLFLDYHGHANATIWADTSFFAINDLSKLLPNNLPFIFTSPASSQRFDFQDTISIVEGLLFLREQGTIASFAPAGLSYSSESDLVIQRFYDTLFENPSYSLGQIVKQVKSNAGPISKADDILLRFTLLGDPALKFPKDVITSLKELDHSNPKIFELFQNYPNPFNSTTIIHFYLHSPGHTSLNVYNINGKLVSKITTKYLNSGFHKVKWDAQNLSSGTYLIKLEYRGVISTQRALLIK
jgi:Peptidase family C25/Secretion system C-terminal sorting domain